MAFDNTNLSLIMYGNGQSLWLYKTTDAYATVRADNYFLQSGAARLLRANDVILAVCSTGGTQAIEVMAIQAAATTASTSTVTCRC